MDSFGHNWGALCVWRSPASMETFDVRLLDLHDGRDESTNLYNYGFIEEVFSRRARSDLKNEAMGQLISVRFLTSVMCL